MSDTVYSFLKGPYWNRQRRWDELGLFCSGISGSAVCLDDFASGCVWSRWEAFERMRGVISLSRRVSHHCQSWSMGMASWSQESRASLHSLYDGVHALLVFCNSKILISACLCTHIEVRWQLPGLGCLFPKCGSLIWSASLLETGSLCYLLSPLASLWRKNFECGFPNWGVKQKWGLNYVTT